MKTKRLLNERRLVEWRPTSESLKGWAPTCGCWRRRRSRRQWAAYATGHVLACGILRWQQLAMPSWQAMANRRPRPPMSLLLINPQTCSHKRTALRFQNRDALSPSPIFRNRQHYPPASLPTHTCHWHRTRHVWQQSPPLAHDPIKPETSQTSPLAEQHNSTT